MRPTVKAVDGSGNVYYSYYTMPVALDPVLGVWGPTLTNLPGLHYLPSGVAVDSLGNLFVSQDEPAALGETPCAFVDATAKSEGSASGTDSLSPILPSTENLLLPFAPKQQRALADDHWYYKRHR